MIRRVFGAALGAGAALLFTLSPGIAAGGYTLSGDATLVAGHNSPTGVQLRSTGTGYGAISFAVPSGTTLADLTNLGADYMIVAGDCGGGSPRFSIETASGNVFAYIGPAPNYAGCGAGWQSTGNLVASSNLVDATQLGGGFYESWADVVSAFGSTPVTGIDVVVDAGWKFPAQTFVFDNVQINGTTYTFESAATCKDGGWQAYGATFKNQGDCVSFFATGGKNAAG